jgi:hypothetical protein
MICGAPARNCAVRPAANLNKSSCYSACVGPDHRTLSGNQAGPGARAERRDTTEGGRLAPTGLQETPNRALPSVDAFPKGLL